MRKLYAFLLTAAAFLLVSCRMANQNEAFYQIRVGVILPLSGPDVAQGRAALDGIELAVKEINRKGGIDNRKIQLCIHNSSSDPQKAAEIARNIILNDNIVALIGGYSSTEALQVKLVAEELMVPYVAPLATHESLSMNAEYTFQSTLNDEIQSAALAYYMVYRRKFAKAAVMLNIDKSSIYPRGIGRKTAQAWADFALREPLMMTYLSEQKSFAEQIKKCIYEDVDVIVLPAYPECALRFILEARNLGYKGAFAGTDSYDSPILTASKENLGDCFFTTAYYHRNKSEANAEFKKLMQKEYDRQPGMAEAKGFDGMNYIAKACRGVFTPEEIAENLRNMRSFYSVSGNMEYHEQKKIMLHPVFIMLCVSGSDQSINSWTVDVQQLKNYRNREKD